MGDVIQFRRPAGLSEDELTRYMKLLATGYGEAKAIELLALRRRAEGGSHGHHPADIRVG